MLNFNKYEYVLQLFSFMTNLNVDLIFILKNSSNAITWKSRLTLIFFDTPAAIASNLCFKYQRSNSLAYIFDLLK